MTTVLDTNIEKRLQLEGKLNSLSNDPRPYETLEAELKKTEQALYAVNEAILKEVAGAETFDTITKSLSIQYAPATKKFDILLSTTSGQTKSLLSIGEQESIFDIETPTGQNYSAKYLRENILTATGFITNETVTKEFEKLSQEIQQQILNSIFFTDKAVSISERIRRLSIAQTKAEKEYTWQQEALLEEKIKATAESKAESDYKISRWGRFIAATYAASQVFSLSLLLYAMAVAITATYWWALLPIIAICVISTGKVNWKIFRNHVANLLIEIWELLTHPTDLPFNNTDKFLLYIALIFCGISGFLAGYFVYAFIIGVTGAGLVGALPYVLGIMSFVAGTAIALLFYKFTRDGILSSNFIGKLLSYWKAAIFSDATTAEKALTALRKETVVRYLNALYLHEPKEINKLLSELRAEAYERYKHTHSGKELADKINAVNTSLLGAILNGNYELSKTPQGQAQIKSRARFMLYFVTLVCIPVVIIGVIYGQLASVQYLAEDVEKMLTFFKVAEESAITIALYISKAMCLIAGLAYTYLFGQSTIQTGMELRFGIKRVDAGAKPTLWERFWFEWDRLWNSSDNGAQTLYGRVATEQKELDSGEKEEFADAFARVMSNGFLAAASIFWALSSLIASFVMAGNQGEAIDFWGRVEKAKGDLKAAKENATTTRVAVEVQPLLEVQGTITPEIYAQDTSQVVEKATLNAVDAKFAQTPATLEKDEKLKLYIPYRDKILRIRATANHNKSGKASLKTDEIKTLLDAVKLEKEAGNTSSTLTAFANYTLTDKNSAVYLKDRNMDDLKNHRSQKLAKAT